MTNVTNSSQTRSAHERETFNVVDEVLRKRMERSVADHDVSHESMMVNEAGGEENEELKFQKVDGKVNPRDLFTKYVPKKTLDKRRRRMKS